MGDNTVIEPQTNETSFHVWSACRRIGVAHKSEGGIVVKLDPGEVVKSGNLLTLRPVR